MSKKDVHSSMDVSSAKKASTKQARLVETAQKVWQDVLSVLTKPLALNALIVS